MAADDVDGEKEKSTFRWLDAARYAVASVVTVLIVTVAVYAVAVVLRPATLTIRVVGGAVSAERQGPEVIFSFRLQGINSVGRVRIYYTNILATLKDNSANKTIIRFNIPENLTMTELKMMEINAAAHGNRSASMSLSYQKPYFDMFYNKNSSIIPSAVLQLEGLLTVGLYSLSSRFNKINRQPTTRYCWPLTIAGDDYDSGSGSGDYTSTKDVFCSDNQPTPEANVS